jgi:hypothetical protein
VTLKVLGMQIGARGAVLPAPLELSLGHTVCERPAVKAMDKRIPAGGLLRWVAVAGLAASARLGFAAVPVG